MKHHIFSNSLVFENPANNVIVEKLDLSKIYELKAANGSEIYLCGGGEFAGWLFENELIDILKLKLNPIVLGDGVKLFGSSKSKDNFNLILSESYDDGLQIMTFEIR